MPEGSEFQTEWASTLKLREVKGCVDTRDRRDWCWMSIENVQGYGSLREKW